MARLTHARVHAVRVVAALAVVAALTALFWLQRPDVHEAPAAGPAPAREAAVPATETPSRVPRIPWDAPAPLVTAGAEPPDLDWRRPAEPGAAANPGALLVSVRWESDDAPAAGIGLRLAQSDRPDPLLNSIVGGTDGQGEWRLDGLRPGRVSVHSDRGLSASGRIEASQVTLLQIALPAGPPLRGEVVDRSGRPVPGAALWLSDYADGSLGGIVAHTDADGRFEARGITSHLFLGARSSGYTASPLARTDDEAAREGRLSLVLGPPGGGIVGRVADPEGRPLSGATVLVAQRASLPRRKASAWLWPDPPPARVTTDAGGNFTASDLPAGAIELKVLATGWMPDFREVPVVANQTSAIDIRLLPAAIVAGTVSDEQGRPLSGVLVWASSVSPSLDVADTTTDVDGLYRLSGLPPGATRVKAGLSFAEEVETTLSIEAGGRYAWDPVLELGVVLTARVVDAAGAPAEGLSVRVLSTDDRVSWQRNTTTDESGRLMVSNCEPVTCSVSVFDLSGLIGTAPLATLDDVVAGGPELLIRLPVDRSRSAWIEGAVVFGSGRPAAEARIVLQASASTEGLQVEPDSASGRFRAGPVRQGEYSLVFRLGGRQVHALFRLPLEAGTTRDVGVIELDEPGLLVVRPALAPGIPNDAPEWQIASPSGSWAGTLQRESDGSLRTALEPGDYELVVSGRWVLPQSLAFTIETAGTTELDAPLSRGIECTLGVSLPARAASDTEVECALHNQAGALVRTAALQVLEWGDAGALRAVGKLCVPPGSYRARLLLDGTVALEVTFDVPDLGLAPARFEWAIPP